MQTKTLEAPLPGSLSAVNNATTRDIESEVEVSQEGRVREIVMDNVNPGSKVSSCQISLLNIFCIAPPFDLFERIEASYAYMLW